MNFRDTEALLGLFIARGYKAVDDPAKADVVLANTCSVRALAENKARSFLGEFQSGHLDTGKISSTFFQSGSDTPRKRGREPRARRRQAPAAGQKRVIGLIGCMARNEGKRLFQKMAHLDLICAPGCLEKIPGYVEEIMRYWSGHPNTGKFSSIISQSGSDTRLHGNRRRIIDLEDRMRDEAAYEAPYRSEQGHANVVISTGCANSCSYCIVPYVRGKLRLRSPKDILAEVKRAVKNGASKITLLGQNVNDYNYKYQISNFKLPDEERPLLRQGFAGACPSPLFNKEGERSFALALVKRGPAEPGRVLDFVGLLKLVEAVDGVKEIDFVSSNPKNLVGKTHGRASLRRQLFELMANSPKIKKIINLPFQSGSNKILKAMYRGYTRAQYLALVKEYKRIVGGQVSTDIIVGFPGETEADFKATMDVVKECKFDMAYIFKYSPRPHTFAADLSDSVEQLIKEQRNNMLLDLQKQVSKTA